MVGNIVLKILYIIIIFCSVDGGVSKNNFICQLLADLTGLEVERAESSELSVVGVGFLTGMASGSNTFVLITFNYSDRCFVGVWRSRKELKKLRKVERYFYPTTDTELIKKQKNDLKMWVKAANRFKSWNT